MNHAPAAASLPPGRNTTDLTDKEIKRAITTFLGLDNTVNARYEHGTSTRFIVSVDEGGDEYGEVIVSEDIYPGPNVVNPNSTLSLLGAAAHELAHYHRWANKTELDHGVLSEIDEAMTSLEAAIRFSHQLKPADTLGLIADALHRLNGYVNRLAE